MSKMGEIIANSKDDITDIIVHFRMANMNRNQAIHCKIDESS